VLGQNLAAPLTHSIRTVWNGDPPGSPDRWQSLLFATSPGSSAREDPDTL